VNVLSSIRIPAGRRGFTLIELLVAMALITLIMAILSQAFVAGLETFRHLKGIGDMNEELRGASIGLRRDVLASHFEANRLIEDAVRNGGPDRAQVDALRLQYEAIGADAIDLEDRLRVVERQTTNPLARRLLSRTLDALTGVQRSAALVVQILDALSPTLPPD
jgi:prepilin-type N-terminal cleavage/methylation domain-containing protein